MKIRHLVSVVSVLAGLLGASPAIAAKASGAVIVRVPDTAATRCINASADQVWLTMRRVILNKESGLFTVDKYAGIVVNTTISGNSNSATQQIAFPRMVEADIQSYASGHGVSIPVEFGLLSGFKLVNGSASYTNVDFDFNVMKGKKKSGWGQALNALVDITKKLPIPASPFTEGFRYFADYANSVVNASINEHGSDKLKQGNVKLLFSPNGQCGAAQDFESTGTIAVVFAAEGSEADGYADTAKIDNDDYCWSAVLRPGFSLKFGLKPKSGSQCVANTALRNDYYSFFLNALPVSVAKAAALREDVMLQSTSAVSSEYSAQALQPLIADVGKGVRDKAVQAASASTSESEPPFGDTVARGKGGSVIWRASADDSAAFDIAQAIRRCDANGISPKDCFSGATSQAEQPR